jgi:hypothetical protein
MTGDYAGTAEGAVVGLAADTTGDAVQTSADIAGTIL